MFDKMRKESSLHEDEIQKKYLYRMLKNEEKGLRFCKIDKEDLKVVTKIYTPSLGYKITSNGFLTWS